MKQINKRLKKEEFNEVIRLYSQQSWLTEREDSLIELILLCKKKEQRQLIFELLKDFNFLTNSLLSIYLNYISDFIINDSGFNEDSTQVSSITYDDEADSSQKVIDLIKMPLFKDGWKDVKTVNRYGAIPKNCKQGKSQIIIVDEFIGSGQTIKGRIKQLKNDINGKFQLKLCFIAGMDYSIKELEEDGYEVFCPLRLFKGISERYEGEQLEFAKQSMKELESKLSGDIGNFKLEDYSFGYNKTEALYSLEGCQGNTPNSVFPIFWWPRLKSDKTRKTLLTRFEKGLK